MDTMAQYRQLLIDNMEPYDLCCDVAARLGSFAGKPLTKRHADNISELTGMAWRINKQHGMTYLQTHAYDHDSHLGPKIQLLVSYRTVNVVVPTAEELASLNVGYFEGAKQRNERRLAVLGWGSEGAREVIDALCRLREAYEEAENLARRHWNETSVPDLHDLIKLCIPDERLAALL